MAIPGDNGAHIRPDVFEWVDDSEKLERYVAGGYHPIHLGDELSGGRYRIIHKLGFGAYSTVWLARDQKDDQYVALKLITANSSATSSESMIYRRLCAGDSQHPGRNFIQTLLDEFTIDGPNGKHTCLVSEAAGCSVAQAKEASTTWMFPCETARTITAQSVKGLAYMHSCGVGHGDLHANNILFRIPNFDSLTIDQVYDKLGEPIKVPNRRIDGGSLGIEIPSYSVISADMVVPADQVQSSQIMIGDFGEAFLVDSPPKTLNAPMLLLPPESFFHERLGLSADIWTLGCTIYEILGERPLFEAFIPNRDDTLAEMVSTLGILPERWWKQWKNRLSYFSDDGSWSPAYTGIMSPVMRPLNQRLWDMGRGETAEACQFTTEEMSCLEQLLSRMLVYEPSARISAAEVMNSVYMTNWACP